MEIQKGWNVRTLRVYTLLPCSSNVYIRCIGELLDDLRAKSFVLTNSETHVKKEKAYFHVIHVIPICDA